MLRRIETEKGDKVKELIEESFNIISLDNEVIKTYSNLYYKLKEEGTLIPAAGLLLAVTSIAHNIQLKTRDEHFKRLKGLSLKLRLSNH